MSTLSENDAPETQEMTRVLSAPTAVRLLEGASIFYIALPMVTFAAGWLRPGFAAPLLVLFVFAMGEAYLRAWRAAADAPAEDGFSARRPAMRIFDFAVLIAFVVACTGIGGYSYQFFDNPVYDGFLRSLIEYPWPIAFQEAGPDREPLLMVYYFAYYLPAALVGKVFGWAAGYHFFYIWGVVGVVFTVLWFHRLTHLRWPWFVLFFLGFGGLDLLGHILTAPGPGYGDVGWWGYFTGEYWWSNARGWLDHWSSSIAAEGSGAADTMNGVFYRFFSPISFLVDGPYHVLPSWIAILMLLHDLLRRKTAERAVLLWAMMPIMSVFVAAGMLPFVGLGIYQLRGKGWKSVGNVVVAPLLLVLFFLFFKTAQGGKVSGFIWAYQNVFWASPYLFVHYVVEFGIFALIIYKVRGKGIPDRFWLYGALCFFLLAPWYRIGEYNDFATKVIIPAQLVFMVILANSLPAMAASGQHTRRKILIALLVIGAIGPMGNILRALEFGFDLTPPPVAGVRHANELTPAELALQGKGNPDSIFWKRLAKPASYQPGTAIDIARQFTPGTMTNREEWQYFVDGEVEMRGNSAVLVTPGDKPLARIHFADVDTASTSAIRAKIDVKHHGEPYEDYRIILQWALRSEINETNEDYPFLNRWYNNTIYPVRDSITANPWWRGTAEELLLYMDVPDDVATDDFEVTINSIDLLER